MLPKREIWELTLRIQTQIAAQNVTSSGRLLPLLQISLYIYKFGLRKKNDINPFLNMNKGKRQRLHCAYIGHCRSNSSRNLYCGFFHLYIVKGENSRK